MMDQEIEELDEPNPVDAPCAGPFPAIEELDLDWEDE
jgi:hypothetical protein